MHKLTFSLLLLYAFPFSLVAQHDSIPIGKVIYKHLVNIPADEDKNGAATLLFNRAYSVYIHNDAPKAAASSRTNEYAIKNVSGDSEGFPIFKKHRERQILYKTGCFLSKSHCIIQDTLGGIEWVLQPEYKRLGAYQCRRATGNFRGREYEAWYTLEIPVSSGPFKLGGLPGLILEAKTLDGTAEFLFQSIEISPETPGLIKAPQGFVANMNFDQYNKANKAHTEKIEREFRAKGYDVSASVVTYRLELFDADSKK